MVENPEAHTGRDTGSKGSGFRARVDVHGANSNRDNHKGTSRRTCRQWMVDRVCAGKPADSFLCSQGSCFSSLCIVYMHMLRESAAGILVVQDGGGSDAVVILVPTNFLAPVFVGVPPQERYLPD